MERPKNIILRVSKKDVERFGYRNPNLKLSARYYKLPENLDNLDKAAKKQILAEVRKDLVLTGGFSINDYEVVIAGENIIVTGKH